MTSGRHELEIICEACGDESLAKREPVYEGFTRKGERFVCLACGHVYADAASVPWKKKERPSIFDESDKPARPDIFRSEDGTRNCRHCKHYVVNPFTQRCGIHNRPVEATDLCDGFDPKPDA
jgi:hypothetical protein